MRWHACGAFIWRAHPYFFVFPFGLFLGPYFSRAAASHSARLCMFFLYFDRHALSALASLGALV